MEMLGNISAGGEVLAGIISQAGPKGDTGETGYTPQKGIDYFTEQDKQELMKELPPHIDEKMETFNQNVESKTNEFNQNATQKTTEYNNNATSKTNNFNQNAADKTEQMINQVIEVEAMVKRLDIEGNSEQETREGKNRFNINGTISNGSSSQISQNGFTLTKDSNNRVFGVKFDTIPAGTYTFSCDVVSNTTENATSVAIRGNTTNEVIITISAGKTGKITQKLTLTSGTTNALYAYISANDTDGVSIELENIQIEQGSEATEYEQYGASPSIDYPSEVKSVGDNINLFGKEGTITELGGILEDGSFSSSTTRIRSYYNEVKGNTSYIINSSNTNLNLVPYFYDYSKTFISYYNGWKSFPYTFKTPANAKYVAFLFKNSTTDTISIEDITEVKLEQGTKATPYSPYGQGSIEIKQVNKNFFDGIAEQGALNTDGWTVDLTTRVRMNKRVLLKKGSYTINANGSEQVAVYFYNDTTTKAENNSGWVNTPYTFTITTDKYVCGSFRKADSSAVTINNINNIQIEKGSTATEYVEHQSQIKALYTQQPFRAIGDVKDRFVKENGVWYEEHNIPRKIFDGTENIQLGAVFNNVTRFSLAISNSNSALPQLCNYLKYNTSYILDEEHFYIYNNVLYLFIDNSIATTVAQLKTWLSNQYNAGTPLYVDYVLATPELIPCTPEQVEVLNDIYSAYGEGMTNIICNDEIEPVIEIIKETKETVQSNNDKAISALLERVSQLESVISSIQSTTAEEGA